MTELQKIKGVNGDYVVIDEPLVWEEREADYKWFENLLESGDYEDGCPLIKIHNMDEWDGEDPHFEFHAEFTRNPVNLFAQYLIEKYEFEKGLHFWRMFCLDIGVFKVSEELEDMITLN